METIAENFRKVRDAVAEAAQRYGRDPASIRIVAISKTRTVADIRAALATGASDMGENRLQEALPKVAAIGHAAVWHFVGHVQSNKAAKVAAAFDLVHSVDSGKLAGALGRHARLADRILEVLIQVNTTGEESKTGCRPEMALELIAQAAATDGLRVRGLMTIGPHTDDQKQIARAFRQLRRLREDAQRLQADLLDILSMGMSGDYPLAIAEGATHLRIGTAIFGRREPVGHTGAPREATCD